MRDAVIRKKLITEQADLRRYIFYPQRLIVPAEQIDWNAACERAMQLWAVGE